MFLDIFIRVKISDSGERTTGRPAPFAGLVFSFPRLADPCETLNPQTPKAFPAFSFRLT